MFLSFDDIILRMKAGEHLKWVDRETSGIPKMKIGDKEYNVRDLFLGRQVLNIEEQLVVVEAALNGKFVEKGREYFLKENQNAT